MTYRFQKDVDNYLIAYNTKLHVHDGHIVTTSSDGGVLMIDGINTFSLQDGFILPNDGCR